MGITMKHPFLVKRKIPGLEKILANLISDLLRRVFEFQQLLPLKPTHGQKSRSGKGRHNFWHMNIRLPLKNGFEKTNVIRLTRVL